MSGEIQLSDETGKTIYVEVFDQQARTWNTSGAGAFESYQTANFASYVISLTELGTASAYYAGNFPSAIPPGIYNILAKRQQGGSPLETDPTIATGDINWNGTSVIPLSSLATSGQIAGVAPLRLTRGVMLLNFPFKMVSATDSKTPVSGAVVSGQISRDGGAFGPLQSGSITYIGNGWYNLQARTSGDLLANTAALMFTAVGADQRDFGLVLQRSSGQL